MKEEIIKILQKSGNLSNKTQKYAKKIIKPGKSLYEVGTKIDDFVTEHNAWPAWPVNLSINNEAAHNSYSKEDEQIINEDDVLKVDIGVSIDGYISDSAQTIIFNKKHEKLRESSYKALKKSKDFLIENYKTAKISDVGKIIEEEIKAYGFKPINNLTGHYIDRYKTHDFPSIPNIYTDLDFKFTQFDKPFAIEPFSTTGRGFVNEGNKLYIFEYIEDKAIRNKDARKILEDIKKFKGLPFSEYWLGKDLPSFRRKFALRELLKQEIISAYPVLVDKKDSFVSQFESTFIITNDGLLDLVNIDEFY
jgi:methionyl aminopeptidase